MDHFAVVSGPPGYTYASQSPTAALRDDLATEASRQANNIANHHGAGKVARVRIEVEFGDGSIVAHEVKRTI